jgi:hypothetical protein
VDSAATLYHSRDGLARTRAVRDESRSQCAHPDFLRAYCRAVCIVSSIHSRGRAEGGCGLSARGVGGGVGWGAHHIEGSTSAYCAGWARRLRVRRISKSTRMLSSMPIIRASERAAQRPDVRVVARAAECRNTSPPSSAQAAKHSVQSLCTHTSQGRSAPGDVSSARGRAAARTAVRQWPGIPICTIFCDLGPHS